MQRSYQDLLRNNRRWVDAKLREDPDYFPRLADGQTPRFLFIGCSDSRVPANEITDTGAGELFVVRNVANQVISGDLAAVSAVTYGIQALEVAHVIVCGHYGCGGVDAALKGGTQGVIDSWLGHIRLIARQHAEELEQFDTHAARARRLVELNVQSQLAHLRDLAVVREAVEAGDLVLHGWVYDLADGLIDELPDLSEPRRDVSVSESA